jgi:hypothetical protein
MITVAWNPLKSEILRCFAAKTTIRLLDDNFYLPEEKYRVGLMRVWTLFRNKFQITKIHKQQVISVD